MNNQYERIVSYIYRYDKGQKGMNVGFARVERRGQRSRITVQLRASLANKIHEGYLFWQQPEGIRTIPMGRLALRGGNFVFKADSDTERLFGTEQGLGQIEGIFIDVEKDTYYATTWKNDSFQLGDWREWKDGIQGVPAAATEDKEAGQGKDDSTVGADGGQKEEAVMGEQDEEINGVAVGNQGTVESRETSGKVDVREQGSVGDESSEDQQTESGVKMENQQTVSGAKMESQQVTASRGIESQRAVDGTGTRNRQMMPSMGVRGRQMPNGMGMGRQRAVGGMGTGSQQVGGNIPAGGQQSVSNMPAGGQQSVLNMASGSQGVSGGMVAGSQQSASNMSAGGQQVVPNMAVGNQGAAGSIGTRKQQPAARAVVGNKETEKGTQGINEPSPDGMVNGRATGEIASAEENSFSPEGEAQAGEEKAKEQSQLDMQIQSICSACPFKRKNFDYGKKILMTFPSMKPFPVGVAKACVRMELQDIGCLPVASWQLAGNRFLLHGYYCYRHLLFAQLQDGSYVLGVPGVFSDKERRNAGRFGFDTFQAIGEPVATQGVFGYWLMDMQPAA